MAVPTVAAVALCLLAWLVPARTAFAHAQLESTTPANGIVERRSPAVVRLRFSEPVEVGLGGIRVFDARGRRLTAGATRHDGAARTAVMSSLPALRNGTYVVTWRVTSADSHPIHGAFTFSVGRASGGDVTDLTGRLARAEGGDRTVGALLGVARWLIFAGALLLVGLWVLARRAPEPARPRLRRLAFASLGLALAGTLASIGLQGAYGAALPLSAAVTPSVWSDVAGTQFGSGALVRLGWLAVTAVAWWRVGQRTPRWASVAGGVAAVGLLGSITMSWHASAGRWTSIAPPIDLLHLASAAVWVGGLAGLAFAILPLPTASPGRAESLRRFSRHATVALPVLWLTGVVQGVRQTELADALTQTVYGRTLLVKAAIVAVMAGVGFLSRRALRAASPSMTKTVNVEVALAAVVIAATALLVNSVPGAAALRQPWSGEAQAGPVLVNVTVDPAATGLTDLHVYTLTETGQPQPVEDVTVALERRDGGIGPLPVDVTRAGPGHFSAYGAQLPLPGRWTMTVKVRVTKFDEYGTRFAVPVR